MKHLTSFVLVIVWMIMNILPVYAQDGITYVWHDLAEIGVSLDVPHDWQVTTHADESPVLVVAIPDQSGPFLEIVFLPKEVMDLMPSFEYSSAGVTNAIHAQAYIHGGDEFINSNKFTSENQTHQDLILDDGQVIESFKSNDLRHYFMVYNEGIVWASEYQSNWSIYQEVNELHETALKHMLSTLEVDWAQALPTTPVTLDDILTHAKSESIHTFRDLANNSFVIEDGDTQIVTENMTWQTQPHFDYYGQLSDSVLDQFNHFDLLMVDPAHQDEETPPHFILQHLPNIVEPGFYVTLIDHRYFPNQDSRDVELNSVLVIITDVSAVTVSGQFYGGYGYDNDMLLYGRFDNITIADASPCQIINNPTQGSSQMTVNFTDEDLAKTLNLDDAVMVWAIERQHYWLFQNNTQRLVGRIYLYFSTDDTFEQFGFNINFNPVTLDDPDLEAFGQPPISTKIDFGYDNLRFEGDVNLTIDETGIQGDFAGDMIVHLPNDRKIVVGTLSGTFTNLPIPADNCSLQAK